MFTGIVESLGKVTHLERKPASLRLTIDAPSIARDARPGDSVCVNGVCLTVTAIVGATLCFDVVEESLRRSNLSETSVGSALNLEPSLRPDSRLGGHFVMGHVDAVGSVSRVVPEGDSERVYIQCPRDLARYVVEKGSIAVNGVSLTVVDVSQEHFSIALIPHTRQMTNLSELSLGDKVNLEVDLMAKYVEKLIGPYAERLQQAAKDERLLRLLQE